MIRAAAIPGANAPSLGPEIRLSLAEIAGLDPCNSRGEPPTEAEIEELARDIHAHGMTHPLLLRGLPGAYRVLDGGRRWLALRWIDAHLRPVADVAAKLFAGDDDEASALSLAVNIHRSPIHDLDEAEIFARLATTLGVKRIAADFGREERFVRQRIALVGLPDNAKALWRQGALTIHAAEALCVGDRDAAEKLVATQPELLANPRLIRQALRPKGPTLAAPALKFVGEADYVAAGGEIQRDFFAPDESVVLDAALLHRLERQRLSRLGQEIAEAEGWGHIYFEDGSYRFVEEDYTDDETAEFHALERQLESSAAMTPETIRAGEDRIAEILRIGVLRAVPEERRAEHGLLITLSPDGKPVVERGVIVARREPAPKSSGGRLTTSAPHPELVEGRAPSAPANAEGGGEPDLPSPPHPVLRQAQDEPVEGGGRGVGGEGADETMDDAAFAAEAAKATGRAEAPSLRHSPLVPSSSRDATSSLAPVARGLALKPATLAVAGAVAASPRLSDAFLIAALVGKPGRRAFPPVMIERTQGAYGAGDPALRALAKLGFVEAVKSVLAMKRPHLAVMGEAAVLLAELTAGAIELRHLGDAEIAEILALVVAEYDDSGAEFSREIARRFDYPGFFDAATRDVALAAIRDCAGEAHALDHSWKRAEALAEEAATLAKAKLWLPELVRPR